MVQLRFRGCLQDFAPRSWCNLILRASGRPRKRQSATYGEPRLHTTDRVREADAAVTTLVAIRPRSMIPGPLKQAETALKCAIQPGAASERTAPTDDLGASALPPPLDPRLARVGCRMVRPLGRLAKEIKDRTEHEPGR
jgi:hypothetical protein